MPCFAPMYARLFQSELLGLSGHWEFLRLSLCTLKCSGNGRVVPIAFLVTQKKKTSDALGGRICSVNLTDPILIL